MVVYNEGHRIYDTLRYAAPLVHEMIIVDQESTDNTKEEIFRFADDHKNIAVIVVPDKHHGYCEPSRHKAYDISTGDWILVLDADERVSKEFIDDASRIMNETHYWGVKMMRSLWLGRHHRFTGDHQFRFFKYGCVKFLDEIHTEPQPTIAPDRIFSTPYVAIWHEKSWEEQLRDEEAYEKLIPVLESNLTKMKRKLDLNQHIGHAREVNLSGRQIDKLSDDQLQELGFMDGLPAPEQRRDA